MIVVVVVGGGGGDVAAVPASAAACAWSQTLSHPVWSEHSNTLHVFFAGKLIIYDSAYAAFITDPSCPKSIFEIPVHHGEFSDGRL